MERLARPDEEATATEVLAPDAGEEADGTPGIEDVTAVAAGAAVWGIVTVINMVV